MRFSLLDEIRRLRVRFRHAHAEDRPRHETIELRHFTRVIRHRARWKGETAAEFRGVIFAVVRFWAARVWRRARRRRPRVAPLVAEKTLTRSGDDEEDGFEPRRHEPVRAHARDGIIEVSAHLGRPSSTQRQVRSTKMKS